MLKSKFNVALIISALLVVPNIANAHYLWFAQQTNAPPVLHFGEFDAGLIERSPGRMDEMPSIQAFSGTRPLQVTKTADHFAFTPRAITLNTPLTAQELSYPIKDWRTNGIGIVKPMYYARYAPQGTIATPTLALDIIPASDGKSVKVYLATTPLAGATVSFYAPNGWLQSGKTNAQGDFTISMPWRGQYVTEVIHLEAKPGTFNGGAYEAIRHRATLSLYQARGPATFPIANSHDH